MPALVFREGRLAGYRYDVGQEMSIGRENAAVTLQDAEVSRRHAVVRPVEGGVEVQDLGSTNGTWVNDRRIGGPTLVRPGDVLRLGTTTFTVELDAEVAPPQPAPEPPTAVAAQPIAVGQPARAGAQPAQQAQVQPAGQSFQPPAQPAGRVRVVATRGLVAMWVTFGVIAVTAVLLVLYFALRETA